MSVPTPAPETPPAPAPETPPAPAPETPPAPAVSDSEGILASLTEAIATLTSRLDAIAPREVDPAPGDEPPIKPSWLHR